MAAADVAAVAAADTSVAAVAVADVIRAAAVEDSSVAADVMQAAAAVDSAAAADAIQAAVAVALAEASFESHQTRVPLACWLWIHQQSSLFRTCGPPSPKHARQCSRWRSANHLDC